MGDIETATMTSRAERLLQLIFETSFRHSPEPKFPLASGALSRFYIDCKMVLTFSEAREIIGEMISERAGAVEFDAVGGMEIGAYPIAVAVSDWMYRTRHKVVKAFVVRKQPKGHGLKKNIEGAVSKGDRVLVVDDVITSGKSTIDAISKIREDGLEVIKAVGMIDRQEMDGMRNIEETGVRFESLFTLTDLQKLIRPQSP